MIKIDLLKNQLHTLSDLAQIWFDGLGKVWIPDVPLDEVPQRFHDHFNDDKMPMTFVAMHEKQAVGMCSLRHNDGIRPDLTPWLGSLVVHENYRNKGIAKQLVDAVVQQAKKLGFVDLYLFALDPTLPRYYQSLGWEIMGTDQYNEHRVTVMKICCA